MELIIAVVGEGKHAEGLKVYMLGLNKRDDISYKRPGRVHYIYSTWAKDNGYVPVNLEDFTYIITEYYDMEHGAKEWNGFSATPIFRPYVSLPII